MRIIIYAFLAAICVSTAHAQGAPGAPGSDAVAAALPDLNTLAGSARASKLIGSTVYRGDRSVGIIEDLLVDLDGGRLTGVVLSVGGMLGVGDKRVAVSPNQIKVGAEAKFTTDLTKDQLSNAPTFEYAKLSK